MRISTGKLSNEVVPATPTKHPHHRPAAAARDGRDLNASPRPGITPLIADETMTRIYRTM